MKKAQQKTSNKKKSINTMHIIKQKKEKNEKTLKCLLKNVIGLLQKNSEFF